MNTFPALLLLLAASFAVRAQEADPLKSPACGDAVARLQSARNANAGAATVEALRGNASKACLGSAALPQRPSRVAQPPIVVPPPQIDMPPRAPALVAPQLPPPPVAVERPPAPVQCDPGGCWTTDGSHLQYVPPGLLGPRGMCTQQGGLVYCP